MLITVTKLIEHRFNSNWNRYKNGSLKLPHELTAESNEFRMFKWYEATGLRPI